MAAHYDPIVNSKTTMNADDPGGWYELTEVHEGKLHSRCLWWNGKEWNHGPNMRRGFQTSFFSLRGITRLVHAE